MSSFDRKVDRAKRKPPIRFDRLVPAYTLHGGQPRAVRMSTWARRLREAGAEDAAAELEREAKEAAPWCPGCERKIDDPVVGITDLGDGQRAAFGCPHCSSPDIFAQWEAEGRDNG